MAPKLKERAKGTLRFLVGAYTQGERGLDPAHWDLALEPGRGLVLEGVALHELPREWGSPLHVVRADKLRSNAAAFTRVPAGAKRGAEVFYSYKTNPIPGVLTLLHANGIGAEVISEYELWLAEKLGVAASDIVFNGPAKSDAAIRRAITLGIQTLNVNHREEIARVARIAGELQKRLRLGLRIDTGAGWSAQFGIPVANGAALEAYREALQCPWFDVVGLHVHRGGIFVNQAEVASFVDGALDFAFELQRTLGVELEILNLGGSLGVPTVTGLSPLDQRLNQTLFRPLVPPDPTRALSIEAHVATIVERVEARYASVQKPPPRIFLEPGRAMTGNTQVLLTTVQSIRELPDRAYAIMDAGINHAETVRSDFHQLLSVNRHDEPHTQICTVVGPICSPGDTLYRAARLPALRPGDTLAIMDAGAYFVPFSTDFSFPRPAIVMLDEGRLRLLRRAERFDDLIGCDVSLPAPDR